MRGLAGSLTVALAASFRAGLAASFRAGGPASVSAGAPVSPFSSNGRIRSSGIGNTIVDPCGSTGNPGPADPSFDASCLAPGAPPSPEQATTQITTQIDELLERVESLTPGWDETSESHMAQLEHQQKLRDGVKRLTDALDQVKAKVATYREDAREIEVENVAIVN